MPKFVLTGVDGFLGGIAAEYALEIRKPDQELVYTTYKLSAVPEEKRTRWKSKGVTVLEANYEDVDSLKKAFAGAEAVNIISTWAFGHRQAQAANCIKAAKETGVKRICYTSALGAGDRLTAKTEEDIPFLPRDHAAIEGLIVNSGLQYSLQRDNLYMDNIPNFFAPSWKFCGNRWLNNTHGKPGAYVSREDCGRVLGALLLGKGEPNTIYEITGPELVTDEEIFNWMNAQTGYKAEFVDMADKDLYQWWVDHGLPLDNAGDNSKLPMKLCMDDLLCSGELLAKGYMAKVSGDVEKLTGRKPLGFKEVLIKMVDSFPKPE